MTPARPTREGALGGGEVFVIFGVMAVDPGGRSGVARGWFNDDYEYRDDCLREGVGIQAWEEEGEPEEQAVRIAWEFRGWGGGVRPTFLVFEGFALRKVNVELSPVMVIAGVRSLLLSWGEGLADRVSYQSPSEAKRQWTSARLREVGLWQYGVGPRDHTKDALRHLALAVGRIGY